MPDAKSLERERRAEHDADSADYDARSQEKTQPAPPEPYKDLHYHNFRRAADNWRRIAEDYAEKMESADSEAERLDYLCRQARAWRRAAEDYAKAAEHARQPADRNLYTGKARDAYKKAGDLYRRCAGLKIERGDVGDARPCLEWAETCYLRAGEDELAQAVQREAEAARRLLIRLLGG